MDFMKHFIVFMILFVILTGCSEQKRFVESISCESVLDCVDKNYECNYDKIDLFRDEYISPEEVKNLNFNYYSTTCFENECRCRGDWMTTN